MSTTTDEPIVRRAGVPFQERPYTAEDGVQFVVKMTCTWKSDLWGYVVHDGGIISLCDDTLDFMQEIGRARKFRTSADAHAFLADKIRYKNHEYDKFYIEVIPYREELTPTGA